MLTALSGFFAVSFKGVRYFWTISVRLLKIWPKLIHIRPLKFARVIGCFFEQKGFRGSKVKQASQNDEIVILFLTSSPCFDL